MRCRGFFLYEVVVVLALLSVTVRYIITVDIALSRQADHILLEVIEMVASTR